VSEPVTKDDLDEAMGSMGEQLRGEMSAMGEDLRREMRAMGEDLRGEMGQLRADMAAMGARLDRSIGEGMQHVANVIMEHLRGQVAAFDEKYQDLPRHHTELRADFSAHASDLRLHKRPTTPAKRTRRPRSR
jgi:hypothetical protein